MRAYLTADNEILFADFDELLASLTADTESAVSYVQPEPPRATCPECRMVLWANDLVRHLHDVHPYLGGAQ